MKNLVILCFVAAIVILVSGCKASDIVVVDAAGKPIEGVTITGTSLSIGGQTTTTDKKGCADIPWAAQETKWISVAKPGYITVSNIDVNQKKPIRIVLTKK